MTVKGARMWNDTEEVKDWPTDEILHTVNDAREALRVFGMSHPLRPVWLRAQWEGAEELARRTGQKIQIV
jgi:hypothetical protein